MTRKLPKGVSEFARNGVWTGQYKAQHRGVYLGLYPTVGEALAAIQVHKELCPGKGGKGKRRLPLSLRTYAIKWLDRRELEGVKGIAQERSVWNRHVSHAPFAGWPLKRIERTNVRQWVRTLMHTEACQVHRMKNGEIRRIPTGRTLSRQTIKHCLRLLRGVLEEATEDELIANNPAVGVKIPKAYKPTQDAWHWLTTEEIATVLGDESIDRAHRIAWTVAIYSGLRLGELWALEWRDVDFERNVLIVRKSKTDRKREVPMLPDCRRAMGDLRRAAKAAAKRDGKLQRLVWPNETGGQRSSDYDARWEYWAGKRLSRHVRFHDLRHTCASHLVQGSPGFARNDGRAWSMIEVRDWLGHSDIRTTLRYAHLCPESIQAEVRRMIGKAIRTT